MHERINYTDFCDDTRHYSDSFDHTLPLRPAQVMQAKSPFPSSWNDWPVYDSNLIQLNH